ncbi:hypothetical protein CERZMDRAFT_101710 [Cercospora zeae-maydis SCOH1-5]|uniref:DUF7923 domain-containing protein n=1 Tax=Cercospora zeae-maydis SCOH1-5 TaxID=717836 RepID=A0A6A6F393_9PEZI|nr:hypothetical protein CERZMDRAFT_101710 [Cercospora zeae-maydis SCOH1-5]
MLWSRTFARETTIQQPVRGQDRDPFVLVLVDGDGYVFDERFVAHGAEGSQNADFKVRAVSHQFAESTQCKHIFFAACHHVGYVSERQLYGQRKPNHVDKKPRVPSRILEA